MHEPSAILPAQEKQTIIKIALGNVYELRNYLLWEDFLIKGYICDKLLTPTTAVLVVLCCYPIAI
jgi:hypothetical protein